MKIATAMKMGGDGNTRVAETKKKKKKHLQNSQFSVHITQFLSYSCKN